jgi:hypothetical protein
MLEDQGLVFACVDAPEASGLPRLFAVANGDLLVVRLHGRSESTRADTSRSAAERFRYLYSEADIEELAPPIPGAPGRSSQTLPWMKVPASQGVGGKSQSSSDCEPPIAAGGDACLKEAAVKHDDEWDICQYWARRRSR